jgi:hypothetical protein
MDNIFSAEFLETLDENNNVAKRVKINHHIRNISFDKFLKEADNFIKENKNEDEYSYRCQNILMNTTAEFLNYMWISVEQKMFDKKKKGKFEIVSGKNSSNFYLSKNPGEATIIFTSLTNDEQNKFVELANEWGHDKIKFFAINGEKTTSAQAEIMANGIIRTHSDSHCVFVTANMAARSFSVPKIVNGIMMVNEPGYASATQKYERLSTIDRENPNKISNMYWFNFKSLNLICPLFNMMYIDIVENGKKKDTNDKSIKLMNDTINIFQQDDEAQSETATKWKKEDIFKEINKGIVHHDFIAANIRNCFPEIENVVAEVLKNINLNDFEIKTQKIGKTTQQKLNGGKSAKRIKENPDEPKEDETGTKKIQVKFSNLEIATAMVMKTLRYEKSDRDFDNFICDCTNIFTREGLIKIGKSNIQKIWNEIKKTVVNLEWKT